MPTNAVTPGADVLLRARRSPLKGERIGLITNQTGVSKALSPLSSLLCKRGMFRLVALFGPEHGYAGYAKDAGAIGDGRDPITGVPVYSLYGETRAPTKRMLEGVDTIVFDIQDVGARFYTYIQTMSLAFEACAKHGVRFVVLDRPNPINGVSVEGPILEPEWRSFLGIHAIPVRHGMTVGEIARLLNMQFGIAGELDVISMRGWRRKLWYDQTDLVWVPPSPGIPALRTAVVYPGTALLEGTNVSEGRGTYLPFEVVGAPWIDAEQLASKLRREASEGVAARACRFVPQASKYRGQVCKGIQVHVTDRDRFQSVRFGVVLIETILRMYPDKLRWVRSKEAEGLHIDLLLGTDRVRKALEEGVAADEIVSEWERGIRVFRQARQKALLY